MFLMSRKLVDYVYVDIFVFNLMFSLFNCYFYQGFLLFFKMYYLVV